MNKSITLQQPKTNDAGEIEYTQVKKPLYLDPISEGHGILGRDPHTLSEEDIHTLIRWVLEVAKNHPLQREARHMAHTLCRILRDWEISDYNAVKLQEAREERDAAWEEVHSMQEEEK